MIALQTNGLKKSYGAVEAVRGLDLVVERGEIFGLVGPDGAGKTTTIRMLCGILKPDAGAVEVLGYGLPAERHALRHHIGYLSQRFSLYEDLSIDENIAFFAEIHEVQDYKTRREELLAFTRLTPFRTRLAGQLSGGMKQKLALACTLIHRPDLIFLDEPTTGVDPVARRDFWKLLAAVRRSGVTILMSTPYLDEAERCTRIGLMNEGRLRVSGTPDEVKALLKGIVVEIVAPGIRQVGAALRDMPEVRDLQLYGDRLNIVVDEAERAMARVQEHLQAAGLAVDSWRTVPPSLENVFISLLRNEPALPPTS